MLKEDARRIGCLKFSSVLGYHKIGSSPVAKNIAGIGEGKESFTHCLIRLMYGTCDHLDEFPQSIVHNSRTGHRLS